MAIGHPVVVNAYFDLSAQGVEGLFTIEDPVLGLLDTGGDLAGDIATDITDRVYSININRGRARELDAISAGTCRIGFRNLDRSFDPSYIAGDFYPNIVPGKRVSVTVYDVLIFDGTAEDWSNQYESGLRTDSSVLCVDAFGLLARKDFDEWTAAAGQLAGARMDAALDRSEVVYPGGRDFDAGVSTLQGDLVTWGSNVLNYLQLVAKSDLGRLFVSRSGVLTYRDRLSLAGGSPVVEFANDGTGLPFQGVETTSGSQTLYTRVGVDREGGILQTSTDSAAVDSYGVRTLSLGGLLLDSDLQSVELADFLLGIYKDPQERVTALRVNVSAYPSLVDQVSVSSLEIGSVVQLRWTPVNIGTELDLLLVVEGVAHQLAHGQPHIVTLALSPLLQSNVFIIEDDVLGLLDVGGVLAF